MQEEHQAKLRELSEAEGRLSAMKSQAPASTQSQQSAMQQRLTAAEQLVQEAAEAAQAATARLEAVMQEKEEVQGELATLRQQMEAQPNAAQHAELYAMLLVGVLRGSFVALVLTSWLACLDICCPQTHLRLRRQCIVELDVHRLCRKPNAPGTFSQLWHCQG
jgi:hypothetical protein